MHYQQHNTSIKLVAGRPTDRPTDIATYRAAIAAKKNHGPDQKFCKRNIDFAIEYFAC